MNKKHLSAEKEFYKEAYSNNLTRRKRKFSWETTPSKVISKLVNKHHIKPPGRVLDLGCGDGRHIELFAGLGFHVIGVDFSSEAIALCRSRFAHNPFVEVHQIDLTQKHALTHLGTFDIIIDWSVLDHIRSAYLKNYVNNLLEVLKGYLFLSEFDQHLPGTSSAKPYKVINGHYSKGYSVQGLQHLFPTLRLVDVKESVPEDEVNHYSFHTLLLTMSSKA